MLSIINSTNEVNFWKWRFHIRHNVLRQPKSTQIKNKHVPNGQAQRVRSPTEHHVELTIQAMPKHKSKKAKVKTQELKHTKKSKSQTPT